MNKMILKKSEKKHATNKADFELILILMDLF